MLLSRSSAGSEQPRPRCIADGPEVSIDFEDGSNFNVCLGVKLTLEAKWTRDDCGQPEVLRNYTIPAIPS